MEKEVLKELERRVSDVYSIERDSFVVIEFNAKETCPEDAQNIFYKVKDMLNEKEIDVLGVPSIAKIKERSLSEEFNETDAEWLERAIVNPNKYSITVDNDGIWVNDYEAIENDRDDCVAHSFQSYGHHFAQGLLEYLGASVSGA